MHIDDVMITKLETLSRLKLDDAQRATLKVDIAKMIDMFSAISEVDTTGVSPLTHLTASTNPFREDLVDAFSSPENLIAQSPAYKDQFITVPKVIE